MLSCRMWHPFVFVWINEIKNCFCHFSVSTFQRLLMECTEAVSRPGSVPVGMWWLRHLIFIQQPQLWTSPSSEMQWHLYSSSRVMIKKITSVDTVVQMIKPIPDFLSSSILEFSCSEKIKYGYIYIKWFYSLNFFIK